MQYYLAPLEGITRHVYRNAYHKYFRPMDKYFSPFISATQKMNFKHRELLDVLPANNEATPLIPQILSNQSETFISAAKVLADMGYEEVNLNLGCPSRTVVSKGRGAGCLAEPKKLDQFLEEIFTYWDGKVSIKTRLGMWEPEEWYRLMEIYNKYPMTELIIHPRLQTDYYKGIPRLEEFGAALATCKHPICYNGDIFVKEDLEKLLALYPQVDRIMLGRGVLCNPGLLDTLENGKLPDNKTIQAYLDEVCDGYAAIFSGEINVLFKMKELWCYLLFLYPEDAKIAKKIKKANKLVEYKAAVQELMSKYEPEGRRFLSV